MSTVEKAIRLSKIAKEFNVGVATIVEFLKKKGLNIDLDPNIKVPPEYYDLLVKEYSSDLNIKIEKEQISLKKSQIRKETITLEDKKVEKETEEEVSYEDTVIDREDFVQSIITKVKKEHEAELIEKTKEPVRVKKQPAEKKKTTPESEVKPKPARKRKPKQEIPVAEIAEEPVITPVKETAEKKKKEHVVPESKPEIIVTEGKEKEVKPEATEIHDVKAKKHEIIESPVADETPDIESKLIGKEEVIQEEPVITAPETINQKEEIIKIESGRVGDAEVKVIGKIDLDALNQKTRPDRKSKKEKEKERKDRELERQKARKEVQKVAGRIETEADKKATGIKKQEGESDDASQDKKKRKRIKKGQVNIGQNFDPAKKPPVVDKKFVPKKKKTFKKEVSVEEVAQQVKDTLARLTSKGKTKSSKFRKQKREDYRQKQAEEYEKVEKEKNILKVTEFVSVNELASMMDIPVNKIIGACMSLGLFVSINQRLDAETMTLVADEFGYQVQFTSLELQETVEEESEAEENLQPRPPIVTVMGHVDHGKTSLLDHIRKTNVIAGEAGGITQHIGAYSVILANGRVITFLDTPGHEAFTAMRARGAKVTDIAIIVVAADDNIMPQTIEAINHAQAAGVPIIFAINKIDKPGANPEKIKEALANMNFLVEDWGGKYQSQDISAKFGKNMDLLLEKVLLEADMRELKANPDRPAKGTVIESSLDKGRGYVATVLVETGTLHIGDVILAGSFSGHVKAMYNERGKKIFEAGPSTPVLILGLSGAPQAGDKFNAMESERDAREVANKRQQLLREQGIRTQKHITLDEIGRRLALGNFHEIKVIVKGDVDGSIEALSDSIIKLTNEQVQINVIHKAVGQISESDVMLASASNAIIIGFQVRPSMSVRRLAEKEEIEIRLYSVIYDAINEMKDAMEGMLSPVMKEEISGSAEIREVFKISKVGAVAGCIVKEGKMIRNSRVRLIRDGIVIYTGEISSLKRFKDDIKEVLSGYECGISISNFNDMKVGDFIEGFNEVEVKQKLK
ncbi:MAG: translation initiation factor IF-2 [Bacteroidia bacterium]|nr:translation initiation factor IF-2 [Bacteroidia bacterium]